MSDTEIYRPENHHRRSLRLQGYDYAMAGMYFVTICAHEHTCLFGEIVEGQMRLNDAGIIIAEEWTMTATMRKNISVDAFVVMPNHFHGIIGIHVDCWGTMHRAHIQPDTKQEGTMHRAPTKEQFGKPTSNSIPTIIRGFKSAVTKRINETRKTPGMPVWQRNYYEHVIRGDDDLNRICEYIINNSANWQEDEENQNMHRRSCHAASAPAEKPEIKLNE
jgi:REP element-mobilizing transposase RayT